MSWKSRQDKDPPPQFVAEAVAYIQQSFPAATVNQTLMDKLRAFLVQEWRNGQSARGAAKSLCSCAAGKDVMPSPASAQVIPKRAVRPPQGAVRGQMFGAESLRDPGRIARLRLGIANAQSRAVREEAAAEQAEQQAALTRAQATQVRLRAQAERARAKAADHREAEAMLTQELERLLKALGWNRPFAPAPVANGRRPSRAAQGSETDGAPSQRKPRKAQAAAPATEPNPPAPAMPRLPTSPASVPAASEPPAAPSPAPIPSDAQQSAALLGALDSMLSGLATNLRQQMESKP